MKYVVSLVVIVLICSGCKKDIVNVIESQPRLTIQSLFAINGNRSVTLGWTGVANGNASELNVSRAEADVFTPYNDNFYGAGLCIRSVTL